LSLCTSLSLYTSQEYIVLMYYAVVMSSQAEMQRLVQRDRAIAEAEGRIKENRENEDINRRAAILKYALPGALGLNGAPCCCMGPFVVACGPLLLHGALCCMGPFVVAWGPLLLHGAPCYCIGPFVGALCCCMRPFVVAWGPLLLHVAVCCCMRPFVVACGRLLLHAGLCCCMGPFVVACGPLLLHGAHCCCMGVIGIWGEAMWVLWVRMVVRWDEVREPWAGL
jgi:Domain of unknown function (DUF3523)